MELERKNQFTNRSDFFCCAASEEKWLFSGSVSSVDGGTAIVWVSDGAASVPLANGVKSVKSPAIGTDAGDSSKSGGGRGGGEALSLSSACK